MGGGGVRWISLVVGHLGAISVPAGAQPERPPGCRLIGPVA